MKVRPGDAARAIVVQNGKILVMKREKYGEAYTVLVGGRIEAGETPEEAVIREVKEETGIVVTEPRLVFIEGASASYGAQFIFLCRYVSGEPVLAPDSEEYQDHLTGENQYFPVWVPFDDLTENRAPFRSERLRSEILKGLRSGFPNRPKKWTL